MGITIRKWRESDYKGVSDLFLQVHQLHRENRPDIYADSENPFTHESFQQILDDDNAIALLAEADGKAVGIALATLRPPSQNPLMLPRKVAYMENLAVDEAYRKNGIAKRLFDDVKAEALRKGFDKLELMVRSFNEPAKRFYQSLGMSERSIIMEMNLELGGLS